MTTLLYRPQP